MYLRAASAGFCWLIASSKNSVTRLLFSSTTFRAVITASLEIVVGPRRWREWCYAFIDFHKIEKAQDWRSDGFIARAASGRAPRPRFPRLGGKLVAEHGQPAHRRGPCRLVLEHIPVLRQESVLDPQDVARDPVRGSAVAGESPVRDDIVPFGHDQVRLVPKRRGCRLDEVE